MIVSVDEIMEITEVNGALPSRYSITSLLFLLKLLKKLKEGRLAQKTLKLWEEKRKYTFNRHCFISTSFPSKKARGKYFTLRRG